MSLTALIRNQVSQGFNLLGDIARPIIYRQFTGNLIRDIEAGTSVREVVEYPVAKAVKTNFTNDERDYAAANQVTQKILFPAASLPIKPEENDVILWEDGRLWEVGRIKTDPSESVWILFVRSTVET